MTEDEMVGWHHQLDGHEFEEALGVGEGQGSLGCCSPWGHKELDTTEPTELTDIFFLILIFSVFSSVFLFGRTESSLCVQSLSSCREWGLPFPGV